MGTDFEAFVNRATGYLPYPYQAQLADDGLPELLAVETGAGKTAAVVLAWLWRRRFHPDAVVRRTTPHWLVLCEPMRTLVDQGEGAVRSWLANLGLSDEVFVHVAMGGREDAKDEWRRHPEKDSVVLGTLDMLLSRALNRGYASSRFAWPIDFGLFHNGVHWVFDEVQLMGPALPASRQLEGLRGKLGTALGTSSTWMSATVDRPALATVDNPDVNTILELTDADRADYRLASRLDATKLVRRVDCDVKARPASIADAVIVHHRPGTLTLAVLNTVQTAREVHSALSRRNPDAELVLLHSRFRPPDRRAVTTAALAEVAASGPGRIVVSTQVIEAGVDVSAATLLTEAAPWPSIVQRAGRCNRDGATTDAVLLWVPVGAQDASPYPAQDVQASVAELIQLEASLVTPTSLRDRPVATTRPSHAVLRRADLMGLFDTAPDLSGNDVDIGQFLRDTDDLDLYVAWRALGGERPPANEPSPTAEELCPVPLGKEIRSLLGTNKALAGKAWHFDHLANAWVPLWPTDLRPGIVVLVDVNAGCYDEKTGWDPTHRNLVASLQSASTPGLVDAEEAVGDDPVTYASQRWVGLRRHLEEVEAAVRDLAISLDPTGLTADQLEAAALAGRLHDIGKAHPIFQDALAQLVEGDELGRIEEGRPWAKSGVPRRARYARKAFRHELASALTLLSDECGYLQGVVEPDLTIYLVAAHHGRVRLGVRSVPDDGDDYVLGIAEGDAMPAVDTPGNTVPATALSLEPVRLGRMSDGSSSWSERMLGLRDRHDLGPFRVGFLEALVRLADWRASAASEDHE